MKKISNSEMVAVNGGFSVRGFCTGWIAGVSGALLTGATLGPVGIGVVLGGMAVCIGTQDF